MLSPYFSLLESHVWWFIELDMMDSFLIPLCSSISLWHLLCDPLIETAFLSPCVVSLAIALVGGHALP